MRARCPRPAIGAASSGSWSFNSALVLLPVPAALDDVMSPAATGVVSSVAGRGSRAATGAVSSVAVSKIVGATAAGRLGSRVIRSSSIGNGPSDTGIDIETKGYSYTESESWKGFDGANVLTYNLEGNNVLLDTAYCL
ncbi:unnamed protein product [Cuscuta campestris]|uniref:Uncharacterized protein n=1 Tax=Cuscuta campestris TaxID=132261 RepID=A0A484M0S6_9ASTE|nr:unnamed protein product [Cuscuta campestris]